MTRRVLCFAIIGTVMIVAACAPARVKYLRSDLNAVDMDHVAKELGPPHSSITLQDGGTVWSYQYTSFHGGGHGGASNCREYILIFDKDRILREWKRRKCNR